MGKKLSLAAVVVVLAALTAGCGSAGSSVGSATQAVGKPASNPNAVGVKVHGDWTLEVREPDGRVVRSLQFHNVFVGKDALSGVLSKSITPGYWEIILHGSPNACLANGGSVNCAIVEPQGAVIGSVHATKNLVVTKIVTAGFTVGIRLKGSAIADQDGSITTVFTYLVACTPTVAPSNCDSTTVINQGAGEYPFTEHTLQSVLSVQAGQQVLATVDLTFSAA